MKLSQQGSGSAYGRYGALPSAFDSTALDEITLYGDLLQAVAAHPTAGARLDWAVIDQALGLTPGKNGPAGRAGGAAVSGTAGRRPSGGAGPASGSGSGSGDTAS